MLAVQRLGTQSKNWRHCVFHKWSCLPLPAIITRAASSSLRNAVVVYSDNHMLVVNKPPGWHSMPNQHDEDEQAKCLVAHLRKRKLGGGSNKRFLTPLHRIDQPCSGLLLFGKTARAAKRIQPEWALVRKTYCVVVSPKSSPAWDLMKLALSESKAWRRLKGTMVGKTITKTNKGWSVTMEPGAVSGKGRTLQLDWTLVGTESDQPDKSSFVLLIRTNQGARHMVRAVLAAHGLPIQGDSRYGSMLKLPFVALHARTLLLPSCLTIGTLDQRLFVASLPPEWKENIRFRGEVLVETEADCVNFPYLL